MKAQTKTLVNIYASLALYALGVASMKPANGASGYFTKAQELG